jgi:hypothetical protein
LVIELSLAVAVCVSAPGVIGLGLAPLFGVEDPDVIADGAALADEGVEVPCAADEGALLGAAPLGAGTLAAGALGRGAALPPVAADG